MAGSNNPTWLKGFSGNPGGLSGGRELLLSRLRGAGDEIRAPPHRAQGTLVAIDVGREALRRDAPRGPGA